jgi:hypothetical protein
MTASAGRSADLSGPICRFCRPVCRARHGGSTLDYRPAGDSTMTVVWINRLTDEMATESQRETDARHCQLPGVWRMGLHRKPLFVRPRHAPSLPAAAACVLGADLNCSETI